MTTLNGIPFYSWDSLAAALKNKGIGETQINKIKLIFQEVDKYDENGNEVQGGDGRLNNDEQKTFWQKIESFFNAISNKPKKDIEKLSLSELTNHVKELKDDLNDLNAADETKDWIFTEYVEKNAKNYSLLITSCVLGGMFDKIPQYVEKMESMFTTDNPETPAQEEWMETIKKGKEFCSADKAQEPQDDVKD